MTADPVLAWSNANQRHLADAIARVRTHLEAHARTQDVALPEVEIAAIAPPAPPIAPSLRGEGPFALDHMVALFGLSPFERDVLLLCAGVELDARFAALCASVQGDPRRPNPTFALALAALPEAHWSALAPTAPLRRWRLVELAEAASLTTGPLGIDERVLHNLTGVATTDDRLSGLVEPVAPAEMLPPSHQVLSDRLAREWSRNDTAIRPAAVLCGPDSEAAATIAAAACRRLDLNLLRLAAADVPRAAGERTALARLLERELGLTGAALLLAWDEAEAERARDTAAFARDMAGVLVVVAREPVTLDPRPTVTLEVPKPPSAERADIWRHVLGVRARELNGAIDLLVTRFDLDVAQVRAAAAMIADGSSRGDTPDERLWYACRIQARRRLDGLAERIEAMAGWDDLVLPEPQLAMLREVVAHVRHASTVHERWGFARKSARGLGIGALFAGASGTGKTMAAEVIAGELRLDLYRIDLSQVVSKYIGETEKNLSRIFDAADASGAILLFDEADALFGKRSEVKDSHDRYANIEVGYLLQRMEAYRGLAILTTNLKNALDPAFLRRLRFVVQFPFPDAGLRAAIWERIFPAETPRQNLDVACLARLNLPGGNIRNIALNAAFLAAEAGQPVGMAHLLRAARSEYAKLEKPLSAAELGGWA
ncbi:MAG: ATP-binding protein [Rhodospirillales bacterium]|nr:MAG: ATP-binding protein [Rhodospirillales bacterium]